MTCVFLRHQVGFKSSVLLKTVFRRKLLLPLSLARVWRGVADRFMVLFSYANIKNYPYPQTARDREKKIG